MSSTSTSATLDLLEEDFAHSGYPHTLVIDTALTFLSEEFQSWCKKNMGSHTWQEHRTIQLPTKWQNIWCRLSTKHWKDLLCLWSVLFKSFWCSASCEFSLSKLLRSWQIWTRINSLLPLPAHIAQGKQSKVPSKVEMTPNSGGVAKVTR